MPENYHEFNIYFSDLNEDAQKRLLNAVGAETASDMNWDMDVVPVTTYCFCSEGENNESD